MIFITNAQFVSIRYVNHVNRITNAAHALLAMIWYKLHKDACLMLDIMKSLLAIRSHARITSPDAGYARVSVTCAISV